MKTINLLKAFSTEKKLLVLDALSDQKEKSAGEIIAGVNLAQPAVSLIVNELKHLKVLKSRKSGAQIFYKIANPKVLDILKQIGELANELENEKAS